MPKYNNAELTMNMVGQLKLALNKLDSEMSSRIEEAKKMIVPEFHACLEQLVGGLELEDSGFLEYLEKDPNCQAAVELVFKSSVTHFETLLATLRPLLAKSE